MQLIPYLLAVPLAAAFLILVVEKKMKNSSDALALVASFSLVVLSYIIAAAVMTNKILVCKVGNWMPPVGISLVVDSLSAFILATVNTVAFLVAVYSVDYMKRYTDTWKFYALFLLMLVGINGVLIAGDIFNLYVFLEIAAIAAYFLVAFGIESESLEAAFKYAVMGSVASIFILLGIAFLYSYTSTLNMADMANILAAKGPSKIIQFVSVLFLMGFGLKAALVPFHGWLPDAHPSAPAPISAMLSGVLIKVLGIYALSRIFFNVLGVNNTILSLLMFLGVLSMLVGVFLAFGQWDFKRLLAYHSISQIGYVVLGIGLASPLGVFGGLFHLFNHAAFKSLLFLGSGAVNSSTGTRDLRQMGGLKERMPVTAATSLIASLSIAGIPPFNGFFSKLIIILACLQANHIGYAFCAVIGSVLTLVSFAKVQRYAFFGSLKEKWQKTKEVSFFMQAPMIVLAVICVIGGLLALPALAVFLTSASNVLTSGRDYAGLVLGALK